MTDVLAHPDAPAPEPAPYAGFDTAAILSGAAVQTDFPDLPDIPDIPQL
ncbi:MAG: hypothetical protein IJ055_08475 [Oscillospiraceae bacterium]|nr:hypothetical protein [Oscillospiraceae bacterium]